MYKEYRDTTLAGAVSQMYMELSGRHRAPHESVQIIKTSVVASQDVKRDHTRAYSKVSLKFPKVKPLKRPPTKSLKTTFKASRPIVIWAEWIAQAKPLSHKNAIERNLDNFSLKYFTIQSISLSYSLFLFQF